MTQLGFGRFVAVDEHSADRLLARRGEGELPDGSRYGVDSRLIARPGVDVLDLAAAAVERVCREQGFALDDLGGVALSSRSYEIERLAERLADRLGVPVGRGVERACSGFPAVTALAIELFHEVQRPVALVTAEIMSQYVNWEPVAGDAADQQRARGQASKLFGDGAAAALIGDAGDELFRFEILDAWVDEVPDQDELLQKTPVDDSLDAWGQVRTGECECLTMPGRRGLLLLRRAPEVMVESIGRSWERCRSRGLTLERIDDVVPHQANGLMIPRIEAGLKEWPWAASARVWNCIAQFGNTTSATIPLALAEMQDQLGSGHVVAMPTTGAGGPGYRPDVLSCGCVLARMK